MNCNFSKWPKIILILAVILILIAWGVQGVTISTVNAASRPNEYINLITLGTTERVSVSSNGEPGDDWSSAPSISADGRSVAFESFADNFVPGGPYDIFENIFVHDRISGITTIISIASDGTPGNTSSDSPSISSDGDIVAFRSLANNLVSEDTNYCNDVFIHELLTSETSLASTASNGSIGNGCSGSPSISSDGRYVAFGSSSSNLVSNDTNGQGDVFVKDRLTGITERVSVSSDGTQGDEDSSRPTISADGNYISFASNSTNLVSGDTNGDKDVFVHDRETGKTERVSVASDGTQGGDIYIDYVNSSISAEGRFVAFASRSSDLVSDDTNGEYDIFVHDRETGQTERVSVASDGVQGNGPSSQYDKPSISADGRYVAFQSDASNLVNGDLNESTDIFIHDRQTGETSLLSVANDGLQGNKYSARPSLSPNGRFIAFDSGSNNFVCSDTNIRDVYVHDREGDQKTISGSVTFVDHSPFSEVTLSVDDSYQTKTNSNGDYILDGLIPCTYTVTPSFEGYFFSPSTIEVSLPPKALGVDFLGGIPIFLPMTIR